jgi:hypothetical protein
MFSRIVSRIAALPLVTKVILGLIVFLLSAIFSHGDTSTRDPRPYNLNFREGKVSETHCLPELQAP